MSKTLSVAASANGIALSQTPLAGGDLTINGAQATSGVASLTDQRRVIITSAGNDSGRTFTIYGTRTGGQVISEAVTGANIGAAQSVYDYNTVTRITVDAATAGAITVGTNGVGSTPWKMPNIHIAPFSMDIETLVGSGTATYNIETTMDDFFTPSTWAGGPLVATPRVRSTAVTGNSANASLTLSTPVRGWRVTITAGTGTVTAQAIQAGIGSAS